MDKKSVFEIKVYDNANNVVKTSTAIDAELKFGAIRSIMKLLNIDDINDTGELLKTIYSFVDKKICQEKNGKIAVKILREKPGRFSTNPTIDLLPGLIYNG